MSNPHDQSQVWAYFTETEKQKLTSEDIKNIIDDSNLILWINDDDNKNIGNIYAEQSHKTMDGKARKHWIQLGEYENDELTLMEYPVIMNHDHQIDNFKTMRRHFPTCFRTLTETEKSNLKIK